MSLSLRNLFYYQQERLREIPTATATTSDGNLYAGVEEPYGASLPGSELEHAMHPNAQVGTFFSV